MKASVNNSWCINIFYNGKSISISQDPGRPHFYVNFYQNFDKDYCPMKTLSNPISNLSLKQLHFVIEALNATENYVIKNSLPISWLKEVRRYRDVFLQYIENTYPLK